MRLSLVICTHNRRALLQKAIDSILRCDFPDGGCEVLVIANACTDDTESYLSAVASRFSGLPVAFSYIAENNKGKSHALNTAIKRASGDVLCFMDDDQVLAKDYLVEAERALLNYPEFDIIGSKILPNWDGSEPGWVHETGPYRIPIKPVPEYDFGDEAVEVLPPMRKPGGGHICVRRTVFSRVGNFSVDYGPCGHNLIGGEDHEFLERAKQQGVRILYMPTLVQFHAVDHDRMKLGYMLRKSFTRSMAATRTSHSGSERFPFYLVNKLVKYSIMALVSIRSARRMFYLVKIAAVLGEWRGLKK